VPQIVASHAIAVRNTQRAHDWMNEEKEEATA